MHIPSGGEGILSTGGRSRAGESGERRGPHRGPEAFPLDMVCVCVGWRRAGGCSG